MTISLADKFKKFLVNWLMREPPPKQFPLCDFDRIQYELRPCDIILIEGRSRVSEVIRVITQSPWSHAAVYIGRAHDITNPILRQRVNEFYSGSPDDQLLIESLLGQGTILSPLTHYEGEHIRICRPKGISHKDAQQVIGFAIGRLGGEYGIRHILDLARFLFPWSVLPRRWRSSIFQHNIGNPTKEICSSMLAEAFHTIQFPVLPFIKSHKETGLELYVRNPKLFTPSDFDYSPYFEIIKYPIFELANHTMYSKLPWREGIFSDDESEFIKELEEEEVKSNNEKELSSDEEASKADKVEDDESLSEISDKKH